MVTFTEEVLNGKSHFLSSGCNAKLFSDNSSPFSKITSPAASSSNPNEDLLKITQWAYQWKMSFNPGMTKQAQKIIFLERKIIQVIQAYT